MKTSTAFAKYSPSDSHFLLGFAQLYQSSAARYSPTEAQFETANNDSVSLNTAKQLFARYVYTQVDSAIFFAEQIVAIGEKVQGAKEVLTGNRYLGIAYSIRGDFDKAGEYMQETYRLYEAAGDSLNMAYELNNLGSNYTYAGNYLKAAENLIASARIKEALIRSGTSSADVDLASTFLNIGIAYQNQKDTAQAALYYKRGFQEAAVNNNVKLAARSRVEPGIHYIKGDRFLPVLEQSPLAAVALECSNEQFTLRTLSNDLPS